MGPPEPLIRWAHVFPATLYAQVWLFVPANAALPPKRKSVSVAPAPVETVETRLAPVRAEGRVVGFRFVMVGAPAPAMQALPTARMKSHRTLEL
jgi:hypothetical protein